MLGLETKAFEADEREAKAHVESRCKGMSRLTAASRVSAGDAVHVIQNQVKYEVLLVTGKLEVYHMKHSLQY